MVLLMAKAVTESDVENVFLDYLKELKYEVAFGEDLQPEGSKQERDSFSQVVLIERLKKAIDFINPKFPAEAKEEALKRVLRTETDKLILNNQAFHKMLFEGVPISYKAGGRVVHDSVKLFDFENIENNNFLAVNQFTVIENNYNRRPDLVLFVNGLPLVVVELKNIASQEATIWSAYNQLQTYKDQISSLFTYSELLIVSDGLEAKAGTLSADKDRFMTWKTINGEKVKAGELELLIKGMLNKKTLLDLIRNFVVYEKDAKGEIIKKIAAYHQYNAVNKAVTSTIEAEKGSRKAGVVWHTQGSGKSLSMVFYVGKLIQELNNPTIVVLTDRNDLDDQLFETFGKCKDLLRQTPVQADSGKKLQELLKVSSGGVVFTTMQKFFPEEDKEKYPVLSERENIVVIADEAHRSQYGFKAKISTKQDEAIIKYGYAKYLRDALPNASFIGFTGTPIEKADKSTPSVFGKYIDVYDIKQAVEDKATVRIFYENRLAKIDIKPEERPKIDKDFEELTEGEETVRKDVLKSKWARLESIVGSPERVKRIAKDIVDHFEERRKVLEGKGLIVCMSRRICVDLYNEIIKLKPEWHNADDKKGFIKIIMTGSASDKKEWQQHIRNKPKRREIGDRFKNQNDELKIVIVRDMWLTGFDVPSLHTMYIDKPMKDHGLMQAIARVNRVFKDKNGGLVVDYIGLGFNLKKALAMYTESGGKGKPTFDMEDAIELMQEKYEIVSQMFHGFNYKKFFTLTPKERINLIPEAMEFILKQKEGKERYLRNVTALLNAFALSVPSKEAMQIKDEVGLFQAIKATIVKVTESKGQYQEDLDSAIKQILSKAIVSDRIIDIFEAAGIKKPDISILSEEFLMEVKELPQKNLAFEMLKKLLNDEIRLKMKKNVVQSRSFREMLEQTIKKYTNRSIETAEIIQELIDLAKKMKEESDKGKELNLGEDEVAFYDALMVNDSAVKILGDEILRKIAVELTETIHNNVSIDWTLRESVQAKLRLMVKKILKKYNYPPDKQEAAVKLVLEQAQEIGKEWIAQN